MTNLYSQEYFPSLDYTFSFHLGLMMRLRSNAGGPNEFDPSPFDEVFRRIEQTNILLNCAIEAEDYQAIGMQLRECLISLTTLLQSHIEIPKETEKPQQANFTGWVGVVIDQLCSGKKNKEIRQYLKVMSTKLWQLVNWLTHERSANKTASSIAIDDCGMIAGHFIRLVHIGRVDSLDTCPQCSSRNIRSHFDNLLKPDGEYYETCGVCDWSSHPGYPEDYEDVELTKAGGQ